MRSFIPVVFAAVMAAAPALADGPHETRGFDPSGPDAAMLEAANEAGQMVNTNQATVAFQTEWYKTHDRNGNPQPPGSLPPELKK